MNIAIILAAGKGKRMESNVNKVLLTLTDKPVIYHTIKVFEDCKDINEIILVANKDNINKLKGLIKKHNFKKIKKIIEGGKYRQDSVYNGLKAIKAKEDDIVLIHNGANPFVTEKTIIDSIKAAEQYGASAVAFPAEDTIKAVDEHYFVSKTLDRSKLWQMQTPQTIKYSLAIKAFEKAYKNNYYGTDDVNLVEKLGHRVKIVECSRDNIKITTKNELETLRALKKTNRFGIGQDSHRFTKKEKPLILGGILIPNEKGLEANSDGDVILHSLFNALSQAIGKKSLSYYADPMCKKGIKDSKEYLKVILKKVKDEGYEINNIGIMIEAKKPRLEHYEIKIKENIAKLCSIDKNQVGVTTTSGEELTAFGKGLGIQVFSVVTVAKK